MTIANQKYTAERAPQAGESAPLRRWTRNLTALATLILILGPANAFAQVVVSAGVTETFDDNIFLESGEAVLPRILASIPEDAEVPPIELAEQVDGEENDDFLTTLDFGLSSAPHLANGILSTFSGNLGAIFFAEQTDFNRLVLNSDINFQTTKDLLPDPFYAGVGSLIRSQSNDSTITQGTATRQTQVHYAHLELGVRNIAVSTSSKWAASYRLGYTDFLGDFAFSDNPAEDIPGYNERVQNQGSDFFSNGISTAISTEHTKRLTSSVGVSFNDLSFTNVNNSTGVANDSSQLDRTELVPNAQLRFQATQALSFDGSVGMNLTHYKDDPSPVVVSVIDENGVITQATRDISKNQDSFLFSTGTSYTLQGGSTFRLGANQSTVPDLNGNRLLTRGVTLTASEVIDDRLRLNQSARFLQFNAGDSLQDSNDRYEFTLALQYSITASMALNTGWTFAKQAVQDSPNQQAFLTTQDYEVNRFFLGLSAGFLGMIN